MFNPANNRFCTPGLQSRDPKAQYMPTLFLQHLTLGSLIRISRSGRTNSITLLNDPDWSIFYILLLKILSLKVMIADFSIADLHTPDGEAVLLKSLKEILAEQAARH